MISLIIKFFDIDEFIMNILYVMFFDYIFDI